MVASLKTAVTGSVSAWGCYNSQSPVVLRIREFASNNHLAKLIHVACGVKPRATPHELQLIVRVNFEHQNAIAVCETASLVMNKPFIALYSRENEAPAGQPSVAPIICALKLLSGIG